MKTPFFLTQALTPMLKKAATDHLAKVINIASIDGLSVNPQETYSYAASKAGLIHLTRRMALRLAPDRIAVSAIAPGAFTSDMNKEARDHGDAVQGAHSGRPHRHARGHGGGAAIYLASRAGDYVMGSTLVVDGGAYRRERRAVWGPTRRTRPRRGTRPWPPPAAAGRRAGRGGGAAPRPPRPPRPARGRPRPTPPAPRRARPARPPRAPAARRPPPPAPPPPPPRAPAGARLFRPPPGFPPPAHAPPPPPTSTPGPRPARLARPTRPPAPRPRTPRARGPPRTDPERRRRRARAAPARSQPRGLDAGGRRRAPPYGR